MIIFIDLETTGLDPTTGSILELAAVATDDDLKEVTRLHTLVRPVTSMEEMVPFVRDMHAASGLLRELHQQGSVHGVPFVIRESLPRRFEAEALVLAWLDGLLPPDVGAKKPPLGGSSVHFDRAWMKEHMPLLEQRFAYRNIDVSTFLECTDRWAPTLARNGMDPVAPKTPHRAMPDIEFSIERLRAYKRELFDLWEHNAAGREAVGA